MRINYINLHEISKEQTLRFDEQFITKHKSNRDIGCYNFYDLFDVVKDHKVDIDSLEGEILYCQIGDTTSSGEVYPVKLDLDNQDLSYLSYYKKIEKGDIIRCEVGDILTSKVRPNLKKIIFIDKYKENIFFTSAFIHIRPKCNNLLTYYLLRDFFLEDLISASRVGKGYPTLNEKDLASITFPKNIVDKIFANAEYLNKEIKSRYEKIYSLRDNIKDDLEIINDCLNKEFRFNIDEFEKIKSINIFTLNSSKIGNNLDLRFSVKYHRPSSYYVQETLENKFKTKIKDYLDIPISLGASISPEDFDESGEYYYISMETIKNYKIELDETQLVNQNYANKQLRNNKDVRQGDIIMARSGVAIGKVALVENNIKGIYADFTMRIRLQNYNPKFAYYYFRSDFFQYLIERHKKGLQNQNIFPKIIQEFPIPDITIEEQNRIANFIDEKISEKDKNEDLIRKLENEIIHLISVTWSSKIVTPAHSIKPLWQQPVLDHH